MENFTDDLLNQGYTKGYNKAIDDFISKAVNLCHFGLLNCEDIVKIGMKLKEENNEN